MSKIDIIFSPSLMCSDFGKMGETVRQLDRWADWFHIDIMDGKFVPNITMSHYHLKHLRHLSHKPFEVHLMVEEPDWIIDRVAENGADLITFHYEACDDPLAKIIKIKSLGKKVGIALKPSTPVSALEGLTKDVDAILFMGSNPGFYGNSFDEVVYEKIAEARELAGKKVIIEVDGGVGAHNIEKLAGLGTNVFVLGTRLFMSNKPYGETIEEFKRLARTSSSSNYTLSNRRAYPNR